ncbi:MAG: hypothetical protein AAB372_02500 [Patescibacteria group bacterium]
MAKLKRIASYIGGTILLLVGFNFLILFASLAQIATGEGTGYWNPYWRWQAEAVLSVAGTLHDLWDTSTSPTSSSSPIRY